MFFLPLALVKGWDGSSLRRDVELPAGEGNASLGESELPRAGFLLLHQDVLCSRLVWEQLAVHTWFGGVL